MEIQEKKLIAFAADEIPQSRRLKGTLNRVLETAAKLNRPDGSVEDFRNDPQAECRWWNDLETTERSAFVTGANAPNECAQNDWLDIGETNRHKILSAAHAVQCWLTADDE